MRAYLLDPVSVMLWAGAGVCAIASLIVGGILLWTAAELVADAIKEARR